MTKQELINQIEEIQLGYEAIRQKPDYRRKQYDLQETSKEIQKLKTALGLFNSNHPDSLRQLKLFSEKLKPEDGKKAFNKGKQTEALTVKIEKKKVFLERKKKIIESFHKQELSCSSKVTFLTKEFAERKGKWLKLRVYHCPICKCYHLTSSKQEYSHKKTKTLLPETLVVE